MELDTSTADPVPPWVRYELAPDETLLGWSDACPDRMQERYEAEYHHRLGTGRNILWAIAAITGVFAGILLLSDPGERLATVLYALIVVAFLGATAAGHLVHRITSAEASASAELGGFVLTDKRVFAMDVHLDAVAWTRPGDVTGGVRHPESHRLRLWFTDGPPVDLDGVESPDTLLAAMDPGSGLRLQEPPRPLIDGESEGHRSGPGSARNF